MRQLKEYLATGNVSYGPFLKITDPTVIEIVGLAGFQHAIIDMEHGPIDCNRAQDLVRAARASGLIPMVRVSRNDENDILRALDIGAEGVHIPHVSSAADARRALRACYYHPAGERGVCRYVRAAEYTRIEKSAYFAAANKQTCPVLHIEGRAGIDALPEILDVDGIGVVFLGPYDLSQSCGVPGDVRHPRVLDEMRHAVQLARNRGVAVGTFVDNVDDARYWTELGVSYVCISVDVGIFMDACRDIVNRLTDR